jgi:hypothetical protein
MTLDGRRLPTIQCSDDLRQALAHAGMRHVTRTLDYAIDHICLPLTWAVRASDPLWWQTTYIGLTGGEPRPVSDHRGVYVTISAHEL